MDPLVFMQAMAALCSFGTEDEALTQAQLVNQAKYRPVELRCGFASAFVRGCAAGVGIETRQVHALNVTANNYFDDGHVLVEAKVDGAWKLFDVANDIAWAKDGEMLSFGEVVAEGVATCDPVVLAQPRVGRASASAPTSWLSAFYEMNLRTPEAMQAWCERIYEVPGMMVGNGIVWGVPDHLASYATQISNYPGTNGTWTALPWAQWIATYYP
jgi:hypothetical protein